ncbi:hypothetical protein EDB83DRAFT_2511721 [Lactarius deliciosus]|nr:hypothetical protein EDB83DRAFT_2511721 [Lactarius deliciosus]
MSWYYDDDEDDDPYTPRIGPAAMPSPRSKYAPYYSGHANTFEDFLEEFEGRAYDCALTDPQRVDVIIRYVDPSLRDFWRSLSGYHSRDWPQLRQSLVNVFGSTTPRPQVMRQKLLKYVQVASRSRMFCEDDVLRFYRQFICFGLPLVHAGHLSEEERDAAFWYGFHPDDREVLRPRLLGKNPLQPPDVPFHFEDVFGCARAVFAYDDYFPSPWSHAKQFEPPSLRREQPVLEPAPRNTYGFRAVTRTIASNTEITTTPDELSLSSHSTPFTQLPPSSSPSVLESQHGLAHSATLDQPGPASTLSTTLQPSASSLSHTSSPVHPATDNDLIPAYTFPITTSTLLPSVSPTPSHDSSLAHSAADENPESTFPSPSIMPAPFSIPMSDFEYLPSVTVDQPEPVPTLSSTPPSSSISSTFLSSPAHLATEDQSEPKPMSSIASTLPVLPHTPSLAPSFTDDVPERFPTLPALQSASLARSEVLTSSSLPTKPLPPESPTSVPAHSLPSLRPSSGEPCCNLGLEPFAAPANLAPSHSTFALLPVFPASSDFPPASASPSLVLGDLELEFSSTPVRAADIVPLSSPQPFKSMSSLHEPFPILPAPLELMTVPISPHSTPPQRPPRVMLTGSASSVPEVTPSFASSIPQLGWKPSLVYKAPSTRLPTFTPRSLPSLRPSSASTRFNFALSLITVAVLVSTLLNISKTLSTFARKLWSKNQDTGNSQKSTPGYKTGDDLAHRLQLRQYTPRALRFVFDPGGQASSSRLFSAHDDVHKRKSKIRNGCITSNASPPIPVPTLDNLIVFDPGGVGFVLEPAHGFGDV